MTETNKNQMDLFGGIFGGDAVTEDNNNSETKNGTEAKGTTPKPTKGGKGKSKTPVKPEPKPPVKVHGDWKADFYGNVFEVSDYVEEIPEEGIEVEELRKEMQKDFFGLSKERAYWEIDEENKYIFLFQKGTSKGVL